MAPGAREPSLQARTADSGKLKRGMWKQSIDVPQSIAGLYLAGLSGKSLLEASSKPCTSFGSSMKYENPRSFPEPAMMLRHFQQMLAAPTSSSPAWKR